MPFRDWLHHIALRGCLIAALLVPCGVSGEEAPQKKEPAAKTETTAQPQVVFDASVFRSIFDEAVKIFRSEKAANEASDERKERREQADLLAQQEQALWAFWAAVGAVGSFLVTGVGVFLIWRTLTHTRRAADYARDMVEEARKTTEAAVIAANAAAEANELARRNFIAERRAWLAIERIRPSNVMAVVDKMAGTHVSIYVRNHGNSPALDVKFHPRLLTFGGGFDPTAILDHFRKQDAGVDQRIVFPGREARSAAIGISLTREQIDTALSERKRTDAKLSTFLLLNVVYTVPGDPQRHQTGAVYRIVSPDVGTDTRGQIALQVSDPDPLFPIWAT